MSSTTHAPPPVDPTLPSHPPPAPPSHRRAHPDGRRSGRGGRAALLVVGGVVAAASIGWFTFTLITLLAHSTESTTVRLATADGGPVRRVVVENSAGILSLQGSESAEVTGDRTVHRGLQAPDVHQEVIGDTVYLTGRCTFWNSQWCGVDWLLRVPRDVTVTASTSHGSIQVNGVRGPLSLDSSVGEVTVVGAEGPVNVQSRAGEIRATGLRSTDVRAKSGAGSVSLAFVAPPRSVEATSAAGAVDVAVPADGTAYRVQADSSGDETEVGVPTDPSSPNSIVAESRAGSVRIHPAGS